MTDERARVLDAISASTSETLRAEHRRRLAEIDAAIGRTYGDDLSRALLRDARVAERPDGCECLGTGGHGALVAIVDGVPLFERSCDACEEGRRAATLSTDPKTATVIREREHADRERREHVDRVERLLAASGLEHATRYDVETFTRFREIAAPLNEDTARTVALLEKLFDGDRPPSRGVFLYGPAGHGKTALLRASLRSAIRHGMPATFVRAGQIFDELSAGYSRRDGSADALIERLRTSPLLGIDDVGTERSTEHNLSRLVNLLIERHAAGASLITFITSNYTPEQTAIRIANAGDDREESARLVGRLGEMCFKIELVNHDLRERRSP